MASRNGTSAADLRDPVPITVRPEFGKAEPPSTMRTPSVQLYDAYGYGLAPTSGQMGDGVFEFSEIGRSGLSRFGGYVNEEFLPELWGRRGMRIYREMQDNDATLGALLFAINMLSRQSNWSVEPADQTPQAAELADFVRGAMFDDMSNTWQSTLAEILSMLPFGWAWMEIVYKRRQGATPGTYTDAKGRVQNAPSSKFSDGAIGWRKWGLRAQETLFQWVFDDDGGIQALKQQPPPTFETFVIPVEKSLLFRTSAVRNNPEGRSLFRNSYRSWFMKRRMEEIEGIGIERDLVGIPTLTPPQGLDLWNPNDPVAVAQKAIAEKLVRSIRRDEQEGVLLPFGWTLALLTTGGRRTFDINAVVNRYDTRILMTALADFIILGHQISGSWSMSTNKTKFFSLAISAFMDEISGIVNRHAIPRLLELNGFAPEVIATLTPKLAHEEVDEPDLAELGQFLLQASQAGALVADPGVQNAVRQAAGFPPLEGAEDMVAKGGGAWLDGVADPRRRELALKAMDDLMSYLRKLTPEHRNGPVTSPPATKGGRLPRWRNQ